MAFWEGVLHSDIPDLLRLSGGDAAAAGARMRELIAQAVPTSGMPERYGACSESPREGAGIRPDRKAGRRRRDCSY